MDVIDSEVLISLVESKVVLWDKTLDVYKNRIATRKAWEEVCLALNPEFESLGDKERNAFGKEVIRRWTNLRDCFSKSIRDTKAAKKSGSEAKKRRKYLFADQLQFLNKIYSETTTVDSLEPLVEEGEVEEPQVVLFEAISQQSSSAKKYKKSDEIELKLMAALEPKQPCSKMAFLQTLMPHLNGYSEREFLQFQMEVLKVIENLNKIKETMPTPQPNFTSAVPSQLPHHQPPLGLPQSYVSTYHPPQFPSHQSPNTTNYPLPTHQAKTAKTTPRNKNAPPKTQQSSTQFLQGFFYSNSSSETGHNHPLAPPQMPPRTTTPSDYAEESQGSNQKNLPNYSQSEKWESRDDSQLGKWENIDVNEIANEETPYTLAPKNSQRHKRKRNDNEDEVFKEALQCMKTKLTSDTDNCIIFGQLIASQMRSLCQRNQAIARNRIQNVLFDLEMDEMGGPGVVTVE